MTQELEERGGVLWLGPIAFVPSIHGKVAFARETRRVFLEGRFPTVAVELPESLAEKTLEGIARLPRISVVSYEEASGARAFFPIDPCDSIVEALRLGVGENCALELIDRDVEEFSRLEVALPDAYAVSSIGLPAYFRAVEKALPRIPEGSLDDLRERHMARELHRLAMGDARRHPILCVIGLVHLRGIVRHLAAAREGRLEADDEDRPPFPPLDVTLHELSTDSLYPILGELPFTTHLYEESRRKITLEPFEAVEEIKTLLLAARDRYHERHREEYERISLGSFQSLLQLIRNLCLLERRLTPSLYEMVLAARGIAGGEFALDVIETAKRYPDSRNPGEAPPAASSSLEPEPAPLVEMTEEAMRLDRETFEAKKRYRDEPKVWKRLKLEPPPPPAAQQKWRTAWDPRGHCSWTPEDVLIERFAGHVKQRALAECGLAQEHLEEFRTSFKDGLHIRETLRQLHLGKIIVKETPQIRGQVGAVVILYERPDPQRFPWKITWMPEHAWESVLAFYATNFLDDMVGPGIARSVYGGQLFVRPRGFFRDVWEDSRLDEARDDAERLVFGAAHLAPDRLIACVAPWPPSERMKEMARRRGKRILYLPLSAFSRSTIEKLRRFHVLNGKPVRSYARQFIR
jgi:hypothetical protein